VRETRHVKARDVGWWTFIRTSRAPELPIVLLEDVGAEIGLFFALVGLTLAEITGNARWDAVGSVAIGLLLVTIAMVLAVEMKGLLIGESATETDRAAINAALAGSPNVQGIIHLRTMHLGPDEVLVAAKIEYDHSLTVAELARAIDASEVELRAAVPTATTVYIEPDIRRT
jgi:divalent metal cation (Fe/Co/Zn/Cd) transporter